MLDWETGMGGEIGHVDGVARTGRRWAKKSRLGWNDDGCSVFEFDGLIIVQVIEFVVGRVGGRTE